MKNFIFSIIFIFALGNAFGQSITISPTNTDNTLIQKKDGVAQQTIKGVIGASTTANAALNLESNYVNSGFGSSSSSVINFNTSAGNEFSIQHFIGDNIGNGHYSSLLISAGGSTIATFEPNKLSLSSSAKLGVNISPFFPITMNNSFGDKISIGGNSINLNGGAADGAHFGLGLQSGLFQIHTKTASDDIVFGYGQSATFTETVRIKGNGKVGIGTSTISANEILEVAGRMRLRRGAFASGLWLNNSTNGTALTDGAFIGLNNETAGSETVGFWLNGAFRFTVDRAGNTTQNSVTASSLAGTGTRNVTADANGVLSATTITKYYSAPYFSFVKLSLDGTAPLFSGGVAFLASGTSEIRCPLYLPNGAKLINARVYYMDNDATNDLSFNFVSINNASGVSINNSPLSSSGINASLVFIDLPLNTNTVDNQTRAYYLSVSPKSGGSAWTNSTSLGAANIVITYTE